MNEIKLLRVYKEESPFFIEIEIHFTYNNSYGAYTILEYKPHAEVTHIITFNTKTHSSSIFCPENEITDTDFINAFNRYFNYKIIL